MNVITIYCDALSRAGRFLEKQCVLVYGERWESGRHALGEAEVVSVPQDRYAYFVADVVKARVLTPLFAMVRLGWDVMWMLARAGVIVGTEGGCYRDFRWRWAR